MSRAVPLSRIQELGIRGRDDPAVDPFVWNVISMDDQSLRAVHEALNPTLLLLALAGYRTDQLVLGPPDDSGDVVLVDLSPRRATRVAWAEYMESDTAAWPFSGRFGVLVWLKPHPGITGDVVPIDATGALDGHVVTIEGFDYLGYDTTTLGYLNIVLYFLTWDQNAIRDDLASRIAAAWEATDWDTSTTGLLAALEPDLWTFPDLDDEEDLRRQAFRQLGEPIAGAALEDANTLKEFLIEEAVVRAKGVPRTVHDRLLTLVPEEAAELERNWKSEAEALWDERNENGGRDPFRRADHRLLSYCELVFDMLNESLMSLAGYDPAAGESAYGGYDLRRGDRDPAAGDAEWIYGGETVTGAATAYIEQLRADLEKVGFGPLADGDVQLAVADPNQPDADARRRAFGAHLESAVREFQIYASLPFVGRLPREDDELPDQDHPSLGSTLIQEANDQRYSGPISGVLNASTRALLKMWVERDWHCPVVVEARELERDAHLEVLRDPGSQVDKAALVTGVAIDAAHQNLWRRNQLEDLRKDEDAYAFIVWDHSGHYPQAPGRQARQPVVIARWTKGASWGGAYARAGWHTWPESECTPVSVLGQTPALAERPQQGPFWSTYRVLRAVSECECQGVLDGMNAYDSAILSGGPIHFTLGLAKNPRGRGLGSGPGPCIIYPGELCPALSLLAEVDRDEYDRYFGVFGLEPREPWADPPVAMFSSAHRKYRGWVRLQDDEGNFADTRQNVPVPIPDAQDHEVSHEDLLLIEVLHHWHWIYRWQMAPRLSRTFREVTYRLSRARLRALRSTPWGASGYTLGQVFTSELAIAILERLHVYSPPDLFGDLKDKEAETGGQTVANIAFTLIDDAYDEAVKTGGEDPTTWGDAEEKALVDKLIALNLKDDIPKVVSWPDQGSYASRLHDVSVLPIAKEEAPEIAAIAALAVAPGTEARVRFTVTDRETAPGACDMFVTSSHEDRLVASIVPAGGIEYDLVLNAPADAAGAVTVTVTARDRRQKTTREVLVNVTAGGQAPQGEGEYVRPDPVGLSRLRDSFQLDDAGLFAQPPG